MWQEWTQAQSSRKDVFSVAAYRKTIRLQGGDTSKFDKEVGTKFKMSAEGSQAPDSEKVTIDRVMLVCQCENDVNVAYSDPDGFGHPGTMGLLDLDSTDTLSRAKMQLPSSQVDANFCPLRAFWPTWKRSTSTRASTAAKCRRPKERAKTVPSEVLLLHSDHSQHFVCLYVCLPRC